MRSRPPQPPERHAFNVRWRAVVNNHSELQEREALKYTGYLGAVSDALRRRSVPDTTSAVAADLGILAFRTAFTRWAQSSSPPALHDLLHATLNEMRAAGTTLR